MTALSRPRVSNRRPFHGLSTRTKSARAARSRWVAARAAGDAKPEAKVAVFVSGGGSNLRALHAAMEDGRVNAEVAVVVSNIPSCGGVEWSRERGIPTLTYPPKKGEDGLTPDALVAELRDAGVGYVLLAGYLRLIPPQLCRAYEDKMLNIHPALLPAFGGKGMHGHHVHEAVVASGVRLTGPTVHFVNEEFDKGKIVAQRHVRVAPSDSADDVAANVLRLEHEVFSHVVSALVDGRIRFRDGDGVPVIVGEDGVEE